MRARSPRPARLPATLALWLAALGCSARGPRETRPQELLAEFGEVAVENGVLSYAVRMRRASEPVLLLHGSNMDSRIWEDQLGALVDQYRVITYDLRGFGRSSRADVPFAAHQDLKALLDSLRIERTALVGLSLGGRVALDFALTWPERVRALVLAAPGVSGHRPNSPVEPWVRELIEAIRARDTIRATDAWLSSPAMRPAMERPDLAPRLRAISYANSGIFALGASPERPLDPPAIDRLHEVRAPTLVIIGDRDAEALRALADTLAARIPGARKVVIPGAGHLTNVEAPEAFNRALLAFLAKN
ncbi:MAG: alpha/beta fold hydrolase [Gemmatimonadetes bacterium]|nr:alpha/beta fold hydrolase [Gemmatimonadota bacterium]